MFTKEEIEKEVKAVFGDDVLVTSGYRINEDALTIMIVTPDFIDGKYPAVTAKISGLEWISHEDPLAMLRHHIHEMYQGINQTVGKKKESVDVEANLMP